MDYPVSDSTARLGSDGKFTDGDVTTGIAPSRDGAAYMNAVYDELLNVITAAGLEANEEDLTQVATAVGTLISNAISNEATARNEADKAKMNADFSNVNYASDRNSARVAIGIYEGIMDSAGTSFIVSPSNSFSVARDKEGYYTITHNLNATVIFKANAYTTDSTGELLVSIQDYSDANSISFSVQDISGNDNDADVHFSITLP